MLIQLNYILYFNLYNFAPAIIFFLYFLNKSGKKQGLNIILILSKNKNYNILFYIECTNVMHAATLDYSSSHINLNWILPNIYILN